MSFFSNLKKLIDFKKREKFFDRIIFNENNNTYKYLEQIIKKDRKSSCLITLENFEDLNLKNTECFHFDNYFIISIFFLFLKVKVLYTSTPDLNTSIFRKSVFNKTKYIYIQHSPVSLSMIYKPDAFINFDLIQVVNKNQYSDLKDINKIYNKNIKGIKSKYLFLNYLKSNSQNKIYDKIDFLIAPTWNTDFYKHNFHLHIFEILKRNNKSFIFRPHYMSLRNNEFKMNDLSIDKNLIDLKPNFTFDKYSNLISDWSGIYLEFLIIKRIKPILINSKMKIRNAKFIEFTLKPIELDLRNLLSKQFNYDELSVFENQIKNETISETLNQKIFSDFILSNFYGIKKMV